MGKRVMRSWFLRPLLDLDNLNSRLDAISFFLYSNELTTSLRETLKSVKDVPHILRKFNSPSSICTIGDWTAFSKVIGVIDASKSKEKGYQTIVKDGFCDELDELRQIYDELPELLQEVLSLEMADFPHLTNVNPVPSIVYMHQVGYLLCVFREKLEISIEKFPEFEFVFSDDDGDVSHFFYRTPKTRELDNLLGDIYHKILDMERAIVRDLISRILPFSVHLSKAVNFAAELDCILSLALIARQNNYTRPVLTEESLLSIQNGRHVLQEMTVDSFIPNDTKITDDARIHIITGPNYSGKSIYIKQVALIVFLSHIGSFVPADAAIVGITDRIFCALGNKLMTAEKSSFMIDLHQMGMMLRQATSRSLCLLDEFGKGTLTEDGVGLLGGAVNHFASFIEPPKVLVCTHLTELFNESCLPMSDKIKFYNMSVLRPENSPAVFEDVVFLYRLVPGHTLLSYGLHCALLGGVPVGVVKRAAVVLDAIANNTNIERLCNDNISALDQSYQDAVTKLLALDALHDDLNLFFGDVLNMDEADSKEKGKVAKLECSRTI